MAKNVVERRFPSKPTVREIVPSSGWTQDPDAHRLLIELPGFKQEQVSFKLEESGKLIVTGERSNNDNRSKTRFSQAFTLPPDSDTKNVSGKFDRNIFSVTVPKKIIEMIKPSKRTTDNSNTNAPSTESGEKSYLEDVISDDDKHENKLSDDEKVEAEKRWGRERSLSERAVNAIKDSMGIFLTAVIAFSLGVFAAPKLRSKREGAS